MSDNVLKFQRREKAPEPPQKKPRGPVPGWALFAGMVVLAVVIYLVGQSGLIG